MNPVATTRLLDLALVCTSILTPICAAIVPHPAPGAAALLSLGLILLASGPRVRLP